MARFEFTKGSSRKFWEIEVSGASVTTRWGRIGSDGRAKTKELESDAAARAECDKLIAQKQSKGYVESAPPPDVDPDSIDDFLVLADRLQAHGDPRGELIVIQHRLTDKPEDTTLRVSESKLFQENVEHFFGAPHLGAAELRPERKEIRKQQVWQFGYLQLRWRLGFAREAGFYPGYYAPTGVEEKGSAEKCVKILRDFLAHPSAQFLDVIRIGDVWADYYSDGGPNLGAVSETIARSPVGARLRVIDFVGGDHDVSGVEGNVAMLWRACPALEELTTWGGIQSLGKIVHDKLKTLRIHSGSLSSDCLRAVSAAKTPNLEDLEIWFGSSNYGATGTVEDILPILAGDAFPKLRRLGLMNSEIANEICIELPNARVLPQLRELDLSMGILDDEGARAIIRNAKQFAHLERLVLRDNYLSHEMQSALLAVCPEVVLNRQKGEPTADNRYVSVSE